MRILAIILFASIFLSLIACSDVTPDLIEPIPEDTVITLEVNPATGIADKHGCYHCVRYKIIIFEDGTVIYDGIDSVGKLGIERLKISSDNLREIIEEFESVQFFKLEQTYDVDGNDCSNPIESTRVIISIQSGGRMKTIRYYYPCLPKGDEIFRLSRLQEKIEDIAGIEKWVGRFAEKKINPILIPQRMSKQIIYY
jgi:hypothetical protein